jgi:hypothetical protein
MQWSISVHKVKWQFIDFEKHEKHSQGKRIPVSLNVFKVSGFDLSKDFHLTQKKSSHSLEIPQNSEKWNE